MELRVIQSRNALQVRSNSMVSWSRTWIGLSMNGCIFHGFTDMEGVLFSLTKYVSVHNICMSNIERYTHWFSDRKYCTQTGKNFVFLLFDASNMIE